jgi:hypothetical protein
MHKEGEAGIDAMLERIGAQIGDASDTNRLEHYERTCRKLLETIESALKYQKKYDVTTTMDSLAVDFYRADIPIDNVAYELSRELQDARYTDRQKPSSATSTHRQTPTTTRSNRKRSTVWYGVCTRPGHKLVKTLHKFA